ncbi:MAG TPA: hypothetical protein PKN36_03995 [bacterium]|nr:hypothetical protein [bacterium]
MPGNQEQEFLKVGAAEVDITPPVGTLLSGSLEPRVSIGVEDPLYVKTMVLESAGRKLAYVIFDLIALDRKDGDRFVSLASEKTSIPANNIVWAASHTHTGPYTSLLFGDKSVVNSSWLSGLPEKAAECVAAADASRKPAMFSRQRSFHYGLGHNRRVTFKNGKALNTWNLGQSPDDVQSIGSSGPIDPEIGIFSFEDGEGRLMAVMFHFTLHTNTNFGPRFSGDYPAVVAARIRERFGPQAVTLFVPGACADINTNGGRHREVGDKLAEKIMGALENRKSDNIPPVLASAKREVVVSRRDFDIDQEERISSSGWTAKAQECFRREIEIMREEGKKEDITLLQAWRIGNAGFASLPGELFVDWGLEIKRKSPFRWTYPVELGGDYLGYLVTGKAWQEGGYESLVARSARPSCEGVEMMVGNVLDMLREIEGE